MNLLYKSIELTSLTLPPKPPPPPLSTKPPTINLHQCHLRRHRHLIPPPLAHPTPTPYPPTPTPTPASMSEIDMIQTDQTGIYTAKPKKVIILWDLDNKPPRGPPYNAAVSLINLATHFGEVVDVSAYANRHAFIHLPHWVRAQRREKHRHENLERRGEIVPDRPYVCSVCGRKCRTQLDLKKHFKQLHERERVKKINRMKMLKGKKRQRFKERFVSGDHKYEEAARDLITPRVGYGLAGELRRAGVFVKTVEDKPQAADWALKRQMQHSLSRGIDWLVLVSDDSDFVEMLKRVKGENLGTVVVGDWDRALGRQADLWVSWSKVENGEVTEEDLVIRDRSSEFVENGNESVFVSGGLDEVVRRRSDFKQSVFSEGEEEEEEEDDDDDDESDYLSDSDDDEEDDWYI